MTTPLQILLFRHPSDKDVDPYEEAALRAFQGGKETGGYIAAGEDLGIQLEPFSTAPPRAPAGKLDGFCHTLCVVFVDRHLHDEGEDALWNWLAECWSYTSASDHRHAMLAVPMEERIGREFTKKRPEFESLQLLQLHELGEYAVRPAMLSLRLLHERRLLLAATVPTTPGKDSGYLRLFISHTKMDGLPLAHALRHQIETLKWLEDFYDAEDLPPGCNWQRELESAVGSSLILMLRTEAYDGRPWCRQEVYWADEYAVPAVLVDARTSLNYPAGVLPFERIPSVRIPDGNLVRILYCALREGLRFQLFKRRVEAMKESGSLKTPVELRVFCFAPSMAALLKALQGLKDSKVPPSTPRLILYPDPPLRTGAYEAAQALVAAYAPPDIGLATPNTLAATKGGVS